LITAIKKDIHYMARKELLYKAGSKQFSTVNLFRTNLNREKFIKPTYRNFYRLKLYANDKRL